MTTLMIEDLTETHELDRAVMSTVHGGTARRVVYPWGPSYVKSDYDFSFDASQLIGQAQSTVSNNGNNVAFAHGIRSTVKPEQSAHNDINLGGLALL
jgi:hypothetical protein